MRKMGIMAIAIVAAVIVAVPSLSISSDAVDSWDSMGSAYSLSASDADSVYELLTNDYGRHLCLYVFDKTGFNILANENNESMGVISNVTNISFSDGIIKSIDNKYETVTEQYKEIVCDLTVTVSIYDGSATGSLTNNLYTSEDRGFSELLSYFGLADAKTFTTGDVYYMTNCHVESYIKEKTTYYYRETLAGDYYVSKSFTETTEVLYLSGAELYYQSSATSQTKSSGCSISLNGTTNTITNYDFGSTIDPVEGSQYTARVSSSSENDGHADYSFSGSTHTAYMTNPQTSTSYIGTCDAKSYSEITESIAKSGPEDLYPNTYKPEEQINSLKYKTVHTTVSDVSKDIYDLDYKYGLVKEEKDMSFLKQVAYAAAIIVFILAIILIYMMLARKRNA